MGAFMLTEELPNEPLQSNVDSSAYLVRQGFQCATRLSAGRFDLQLCKKYNGDLPALFLDTASKNFCAVVGTIIYKSLIGSAAAELLFRDFDGAHLPYANANGSYCAILFKDGRLYLWTDQLGTYKVYSSQNGSIYSSSFLSVLATVKNPKLDTQSAFEYVFQGACYGDSTIIQDVKLAEANTLHQFLPRYSSKPGSQWWQSRTNLAAIDVSENCLASMRHTADSLRQFAPRCVDSAISGGYDSRLLLGLLLEQGIKPNLHVYGSKSSADVQIAKIIAATLKIELEHIDKSVLANTSLDSYPTVVEKNFHAFDGLPTDGIFNSGADLISRKMRSECCDIMLNGGGGEIFRNFFYLPDKKYTIDQVARSFYAQFSPNFCTEKFNARDYLATLVTKIRSSIAAENESISRRDVETIYPLFRLRYWMGKNNSVNNRFGMALTPFSEPNIVQYALDIPIQEKNHGRAEARMIREVSPDLAACTSDYGHSFDVDPPLTRQLSDALTMYRPPWIRQYTYRIKSALRGNTEFGPFLSPAYVQAALGGSCEIVNVLFRMQRINDPACLVRVLTLEYLCRQHNVTVE